VTQPLANALAEAARLLEAAGPGDFPCVLAVADLVEEAGDAVLAAGLRLLAEGGLSPADGSAIGTRGDVEEFGRWRWYREGTRNEYDSWIDDDPTDIPPDSALMPEEAWAALGGFGQQPEYDPCYWKSYATYAAAALAAARVLRPAP
jgi:hypothetical protein